ncbi:Peptide transporter [Pseudozyma hubeiensis]|nr:Peptide transporter [Pseudozyma hubeiensis]
MLSCADEHFGKESENFLQARCRKRTAALDGKSRRPQTPLADVRICRQALSLVRHAKDVGAHWCSGSSRRAH